MSNFDYMTPTRLIFGENAIAKLPEVVGAIGKKVLLTYGGGSIKKIGLYDSVKELLKDFEIVELPGIQPNPKYDPSVLDGVRLCKEHDIDVILSVGGGSVLDCSKPLRRVLAMTEILGTLFPIKLRRRKLFLSLTSLR